MRKSGLANTKLWFMGNKDIFNDLKHTYSIVTSRPNVGSIKIEMIKLVRDKYDLNSHVYSSLRVAKQLVEMYLNYDIGDIPHFTGMLVDFNDSSANWWPVESPCLGDILGTAINDRKIADLERTNRELNARIKSVVEENARIRTELNKYTAAPNEFGWGVVTISNGEWKLVWLVNEAAAMDRAAASIEDNNADARLACVVREVAEFVRKTVDVPTTTVERTVY